MPELETRIALALSDLAGAIPRHDLGKVWGTVGRVADAMAANLPGFDRPAFMKLSSF